MLIDHRAERSSELAEWLECVGCLVVGHTTAGGDIERAIARAEPDIIIIDLDSPDRDTLEGMRRIGEEHPRPVVMFVDESDQESIQSAVQAGVAAYVVKGASAERVRPVLDVAIARFREHQALKKELREARAGQEERKLVDEAKRLLMERRDRTEPQAYRMLRTMAMEQNMRMVEVARRILAMKDIL